VDHHVEHPRDGSLPCSPERVGLNDMIRPRVLLALILCLALCMPTYADQASAAFKRGVRAESKNQRDAAFEAYKQAYALKPKEPKYAAAYLRVRTAAAISHVQNGEKLLNSGDLEGAVSEFQRAQEIDGTNFLAGEEMRRAAFLLKRKNESGGKGSANQESKLTKQAEDLEGPVTLEPSPDTPITLRMTTTADNVYKSIGKLGGINVLFDLDYKPQKIAIELNEVKLEEALKMVALESKTFWRPISSTAIFVAAEAKRKELESSVMKTFYIQNASTPGELQEVVGTLKGMLDIGRVQVNPTHSSITIRATPDQLVLAEKLLETLDKPKSEVIIDVAVMEVNRDRLRTLGSTVPTSTTVGPAAAGGSGTTGGATGLVQLASLAGTPMVTPIPSVTYTLLMSDTDTKVLQNPELRALNDEKASLKIGERVPIATGSYTPGAGGVSINPLINTQFQYLDVGVNIDITPHIHSEHEVTLKMSLEVSSVTGTQNIGGISQPTIGQRRIEHESRLEDGEVNLVGGILEDTETQSLSGYPWLAKIPILKYLFAQENKQRTENEIVFAITPHIVRAEEVTDEDLRLVDVGTSSTIGLRFKESTPASPTVLNSTPATAPNPGRPAQSAPDATSPQNRRR
jgi:general secretion pathway protein D